MINKNAIQTINILIPDICQSVWHFMIVYILMVSTLYHL
mgnify:CR=1 FL=1